MLPRRPGNLPAGVAACLLYAASSGAFGVAELAGDEPSWFAGLMLVFAPFVLAVGIWAGVAGATGRGRMVLTPSGLVYVPLFGRRPVTVPWTTIDEVVSDGGYGNGIFVLTHQRRIGLWTGGQGVPPETLVASLTWYAEHARDRPETIDSAAVTRRIQSVAARSMRISGETD
ncbi:hypothetical protein [Nocardioides ferulae]|uniref:hypothetical protein n=1 Tax=Nocardioides ferulae TaxID=2340821 RepID=UPI000EACF233|nr:hypothetical protein [Nocardioides ferulae]